jgi:N-acetylmuramoyl-L-alanine amidase
VRRLCAILALAILGWAPDLVAAQGLQALARLDAVRSEVTARASGDVDIRLKLTQAVPYRVFTLDDPVRLVLDFREVNFAAVSKKDIVYTDLVTDMRYGMYRPGWSRLVLVLKRPMRVFRAEMQTDPAEGDALIEIRLTPEDPDVFAAQTGPAVTSDWELPDATPTLRPKRRPMGERRIVVALDPGHGGIDPGAEYDGHTEADLMLTLARELKERLVLSGRYDVFLTRDEDMFLSLESRVSEARARGADAFISLHADALAEGRASGATVYTLSDTATDEAAELLAAGHERSDLLAGVDLSAQDDQLAWILMDMARIETQPRADRLADELVAGIAKATGRIRSRPRLGAAFSVLKAPDIPSVLIEFGFMSNPSDLANLTNPEWRGKVLVGILGALDRWSIADAAEARLLRQ